jgi:hypothetical protein
MKHWNLKRNTIFRMRYNIQLFSRQTKNIHASMVGFREAKCFIAWMIRDLHDFLFACYLE